MQTRLPRFAGLATVLALSVHLAEAAQTAKSIATKDTRFYVRFQVPSASSSKDEPREVELHASADQGTTWEVVGVAKPSDGKVLFRASADGEYWFMPRTKYASGKYLPQGPPTPELKVVVDTNPPVVEIDARIEDGEVIIRWHVADQHLKAESFRLEYRATTPGAQWQRIAVDRTGTPDEPANLRGETAFVLAIREQATPIVLRAEVNDEAGNHTVKEQPVTPPTVAAVGHTEGADRDGPPEMSSKFTEVTEPVSPRPAAPPSYPKTTTPEWTAEESPPLAGNSHGPEQSPAPAARRNLSNASYRSEVERLGELPNGPSTPRPGNEETLPPGVQPHLVNKPRFELIYDVEAVGSAGVDQVELWMTTDGGRTWKSYGLDEDCRSPMPVKVKGEGIYGFRVVVETTTGLRSPTPVGGDLPDVWVEVDTTRPEARLLSADQGNGDEADRLVICWEASDQHLAGRGISLRWAESPQGPWSTIASGLENTGRYAWRLDQRVPRQIYLLLEARDEAGNIAINPFAQPVSLDLIRPQGRIREVRPVGAAPAGGRRL
ncbi:MAG TPA: hypothetical protein VFI31_29060 [Pirellulales bacterium]|nr:hypothetical protein [Pirellulales bacterium]